ncbi:MAG: hypothetical protein IJP35_06185 [Clostridia bacterium]|nr:hypothetical protein [Clostridia bacterium]
MKKVLCLLLVSAMLMMPFAAQATTVHTKTCWCAEHLDGSMPYTPGDTNRDGKADSYDALRILKLCIGRLPSSMPIYTEGIICPSIFVADVNNDQYINAEDALEVLKYVVGKVDGFARQPVYYQPETPTDV